MAFHERHATLSLRATMNGATPSRTAEERVVWRSLDGRPRRKRSATPTAPGNDIMRQSTRQTPRTRRRRGALLALFALSACSSRVTPLGADGSVDAADEASPDSPADARSQPSLDGAQPDVPEALDASADVIADTREASMPPGDACTDTDLSRCPALSVCVNGYCARRYSNGSVYYYCDGRTAVPLASSADHCGRCDHACGANAECRGGACFECGVGLARCGGSTCGVNLRTSREHCGACDVACAATERCAEGVCTGCLTGSALCAPDTCVDVTRDNSHCGACNVRCQSLPRGASSCTAGRCVIATCAAGTAECDGDVATPCETVTSLDRAHCGACGHACAVGASCLDGRCEAQALRLRVPSSFTTVTSARPTLWWFPAAGSNGSRVQLCRDVACSAVVTQQDVTGDRHRLSAALTPGVYFWRVTALRDGRPEEASATWQFRVDATPTRILGYAVGSLGDVNGDNRADRTDRTGVWLGSPSGEVPSYVGSTTEAPSRQLLDAELLGDLDGDGYGDAALSWSVSFSGGTLQYYSQICHGDASQGLRCTSLGGPTWSRTTFYAGGDFNHDGTHEMALLEGSIGGGTLGVGGSVRPLRSGPCWRIAAGTISPTLLVRDLNDDGYDDLEATAGAQQLRLLGGPTGLSVAACDE